MHGLAEIVHLSEKGNGNMSVQVRKAGAAGKEGKGNRPAGAPGRARI